MDAERALAERGIHYFHDGIGHGTDVSIGRDDGCEALAHLFSKPAVRSCLVFRGSCLVLR